MTDTNLQHSIDQLTHTQQHVLKVSNQWWRPLVNGALYGVGASVGVAVVLTLAAAALRHAAVIPVVGRWLAELTPFVQSALHR